MIVAMQRRPDSSRWGRRPGSPAAVVGVDRSWSPARSGRPPSTTGRPALRQERRQRVVAVQRQQQRAVDVLAGEVALEPLPLAGDCAIARTICSGDARQRRDDAADDAGEEGLGEEPLPDSKITRAIESVRWVTRARAARFGT